MVTRSDLTQAVYTRIQYSSVNREKARELVDTVLETITKSLIEKEEVKLAGFGVFHTERTPMRTGRNPKTGKSAEITARYVIKFRASSIFKDCVEKAHKNAK